MDVAPAPPSSEPAPALRERRRLGGAPRTDQDVVRVITVNTHRGQGPKLRYLLETALPTEKRRILLLHDTRAYTYHIADWLHRHADRYHVVALQEVFYGLFGAVQQVVTGRSRQIEYYRTLGGFPHTITHRVGFSAFQYQNVLLSRLLRTGARQIHEHLPGRVFRLAACGFTLAPFRWQGQTVYLGNTHLHAYNPRARAQQAESIAREIRRLGDVPVIFLGDFNTVPPGCRQGDFPHGDRDRHSYRGDTTLRCLADVGLRTIEHRDDPDFWTYPTGMSNRTLDYVLFSRHWEVEDYRVVREFTLSDHYPVEAALRLRPR
jgi:endonuclease/exonuclease/phosphatase family metal-dependent hydrolase